MAVGVRNAQWAVFRQ